MFVQSLDPFIQGYLFISQVFDQLLICLNRDYVFCLTANIFLAFTLHQHQSAGHPLKCLATSFIFTLVTTFFERLDNKGHSRFFVGLEQVFGLEKSTLSSLIRRML